MPAFLTHWRILIETARCSQDVGSDLGSLITSATALRRRAHGWSTPLQTTPAGAVWDTGPLPEIDFRFPGSDVSAMAFLGALAPDMLYYSRRYFYEKLTDANLRKVSAESSDKKHSLHWSDLFHTSHTGDTITLFLEHVALVPSPALRSQALAFALGYVSHIAADIALNPWIDALTSYLSPPRIPGAHSWGELLLDEYLAATYFDHPRYSLIYQPWKEYIEPAAHSLAQKDTLAAQILHLLTNATEVYRLDDEQTATLSRDFLKGLRGLCRLLVGRGEGRWLSLLAAQWKKQREALASIVVDPGGGERPVSLEMVLDYATCLSVRLCRAAINYYTVLRNPNAEASERRSRRMALINDLRNWNLHTGYDTNDTPGESASPSLHNWAHFADIWKQEEQGQAPLKHSTMPAG